MRHILKLLEGGDFRSIGAANEVVSLVEKTPKLFDDLVSGLQDDNPLVRMRAADAIEKLTRQQPTLLAPYEETILGPVAAIPQQEVQWHVAQLIPRLALTGRNLGRARHILDGYLASTESNIVRVMCLQALAELALQDKIDRASTAKLIARYASAIGTPSVRARSRALLQRLGQFTGPGADRR